MSLSLLRLQKVHVVLCWVCPACNTPGVEQFHVCLCHSALEHVGEELNVLNLFWCLSFILGEDNVVFDVLVQFESPKVETVPGNVKIVPASASEANQPESALHLCEPASPLPPQAPAIALPPCLPGPSAANSASTAVANLFLLCCFTRFTLCMSLSTLKNTTMFQLP
jgi:hypothetical protein